MEGSYSEVLSAAVQRTNSEIIIFFVIFLVALVIVFLPLYRMISGDRHTRQKNEQDHQRSIHKIITSSTSASLKRIHDRLDVIYETLIHMKPKP